MTAATITEFSVEPIVSDCLYGTPSRRVKVYLRVTVDAGGSNTVNLQTYLPAIADVEGVTSVTDDNVALDVASDVTWSTYTVTVVPAGAIEVSMICTLT